jgi:hypothetical protein
MEEVIDFDQWYQTHNIEIEYWAVYDPETGKVKGIYPNQSADSFEHKIKVDQETGEAIGSGKISLANCYIDFESDTLEIIEIKSLIKIDDVLHRIIDSRWADSKDPDLTISVKDNNLIFSLSDKVKSKKRIHYNGDTIMDFYITEYNDPNILFEKFSIQLNQLIDEEKSFQIKLPQKFSVYTRRIFKKYILINENN